MDFAAFIVNWLRTVDPRQLESWASSGASMVDVLRKSIPVADALLPAAARSILGPSGVAQARAMTDADFRAILDRVMDSLPDHGAILWLYEDWYLDQIRRIRDIVVG
jgi:hypothetical protein